MELEMLAQGTEASHSNWFEYRIPDCYPRLETLEVLFLQVLKAKQEKNQWNFIIPENWDRERLSWTQQSQSSIYLIVYFIDDFSSSGSRTAHRFYIRNYNRRYTNICKMYLLNGTG